MGSFCGPAQQPYLGPALRRDWLVWATLCLVHLQSWSNESSALRQGEGKGGRRRTTGDAGPGLLDLGFWTRSSPFSDWSGTVMADPATSTRAPQGVSGSTRAPQGVSGSTRAPQGVSRSRPMVHESWMSPSQTWCPTANASSCQSCGLPCE